MSDMTLGLPNKKTEEIYGNTKFWFQNMSPPAFMSAVFGITFAAAVVVAPHLPSSGYEIPSGEALEQMSAGRELKLNIPSGTKNLSFRFDDKKSIHGHLLWETSNGKHCRTPADAIFEKNRTAGQPFVDVKLTAGIISRATICE